MNFLIILKLVKEYFNEHIKSKKNVWIDLHEKIFVKAKQSFLDRIIYYKSKKSRDAFSRRLEKMSKSNEGKVKTFAIELMKEIRNPTIIEVNDVNYNLVSSFL